MSVQLPPSLERLARSNPVQVDDELGRQPSAQAALSKILATERARPGRARRRRSGRVVTVVFALLLVGAGAAVAAADPFGFWRSSTLDTARYGVNPSRHVSAPTPRLIRCATTHTTVLRCGADVSGQAYQLVDRVPAPGALSRAAITTALVQTTQRGRVSASFERRVRADLAAVSDTFLARLSEAMRFGTYGGGATSVPPAGVPMWLVCEPSAGPLACRNLNGDEDAAVGSGVYMALPAGDWIPASPAGGDGQRATAQLMRAIFGAALTPAETRLLQDLASTASTQTATGGGPARVSSGSGR